MMSWSLESDRRQLQWGTLLTNIVRRRKMPLVILMNIEGHIYDGAKKYATAAFDVLSKLEASTDVKKLLFKARLSTMIDYAYALLSCGRLSENEELRREIFDDSDQFLGSDDVFMARKLKKLFTAIGESERGEELGRDKNDKGFKKWYRRRELFHEP